MKSCYQQPVRAIIALFVLALAGPVQGQTVEGVDWRRHGADFSKYSKILLKPLDISDVKVLKPAWEQDDPEEWGFQPGTGEVIQELFWNSMSGAISGEGGYEIVSEEGQDVLQLEVEFLSITPYIKPGSDPRAEGYVIETLGSGDVVVSAELRDSVTGSLLALVEGERQIGTEYRELSPESHMANLEATFSKWGSRVREALDQARNP